MSLLRCEALEARYGDKVVFKKLSFDLYPGESLAVVGRHLGLRMLQ